MCRKVVEKLRDEIKRYPVGTGALAMSENLPEQRIGFTTNPLYRGRPDADQGAALKPEERLPRSKRVQVDYFPEDVPRWLLFKQGYFDISSIPRDLTLHNRGAPYYLYFSRFKVYDAASSPTLTIEPGVEIRMDDYLQIGEHTSGSVEHFAKLIRSDKPDRKVKLGLVRNGRETTADVTLSLGPVLTIAAASKPDDKKNAEVPRGLLKPGAPARVSVAVTPLAKDNLNVLIEYEQEGTGKLGELKCTGNRAEIDKQVRQLPARVQDLTRAALTRFYESQKK